jgi:hypothetical protein
LAAIKFVIFPKKISDATKSHSLRRKRPGCDEFTFLRRTSPADHLPMSRFAASSNRQLLTCFSSHRARKISSFPTLRAALCGSAMSEPVTLLLDPDGAQTFSSPWKRGSRPHLA